MNPRLPLLLALLAALAPAARADERAIVRIADGDAHYRQALGRHFGHLPRDRKFAEIVLEVDTADWAWLEQRGYAPRFDAVLSAQLRNETLAKTIPGYACYSTVEETDTFINDQVAAHPALASVIDIGDSWEKVTAGGLPGYDLRVLKIGNSAIAGDKPKMMVMSGLHPRELTPVQLNLKFAEWLLTNYGSSAEATWLVDHNEFHLLLQANPDGRKIAEGGPWQRKNRHNYGSCTGTSIGVDLNRNFPFYWSLVPNGSSGNACESTYRGPSAASEPETQAVNAYVTALFPDTRVGSENSLTDAASTDTRGLYIDAHSYGGTILFPWGVTESASGNDAAFKAITRRTTWFNNYDPSQSSTGLYLTDGASDDDAYGRLGVPAFTWELGTEFFEQCSVFNSELTGNLNALRYSARVLHRPYQLPAGPDAYGASASPASVTAGAVVTVTASASDARFNHSNGSEPMQNVTAAIATVDRLPWDPLAVALPVAAADAAFNASTENLVVQIATTGWTAGRHIVFVQASDASGAAGAPAAVFIDIEAVPVLFGDGFE
ncbi:MAG: hypothetical protein IPH76_04745 [Xanthomonadales bacterium]|nr:hypothetical protein [Xanthomonadales bacterium]